MDDEQFLWACEQAVRSEEYLPGPAAILRIAQPITAPVPEPTPYHLRALPSPDETEWQKRHAQRESERRAGDPNIMEHWRKRLEAARERWSSRGEA